MKDTLVPNTSNSCRIWTTSGVDKLFWSMRNVTQASRSGWTNKGADPTNVPELTLIAIQLITTVDLIPLPDRLECEWFAIWPTEQVLRAQVGLVPNLHSNLRIEFSELGNFKTRLVGRQGITQLRLVALRTGSVEASVCPTVLHRSNRAQAVERRDSQWESDFISSPNFNFYLGYNSFSWLFIFWRVSQVDVRMCEKSVWLPLLYSPPFLPSRRCLVTRTDLFPTILFI